MMNVQVNEVIATCMSLGMFVSINQRLDAENLALVAEEFGYEIDFVSVEVQEAIHQIDEEDSSEGMKDDIILSNVVFPEPVPPEITIFNLASTHAFISSRDGSR